MLKAIDLARLQSNMEIKAMRYDTPQVPALIKVINKAIKAGKVEELALAIAKINAETSPLAIQRKIGGGGDKNRHHHSLQKQRRYTPFLTAYNALFSQEKTKQQQDATDK